MAEIKLDPQDQCSVFECDHRDCLLAYKATPLVAEDLPHAPRHRWSLRVGYMSDGGKCVLLMTGISLILAWLPPETRILAYSCREEQPLCIKYAENGNFFSLPFYSDHFGYKICPRLYIIGMVFRRSLTRCWKYRFILLERGWYFEKH